MITKIITTGDKQNGQLYNDLFIDASKALAIENEDEYISSLNQYFQNLPDLILSEEFHPKYMILPLDEEPFVINANTRTITVPQSFSKCASVQGDQAAETIFFIIDRYFDTMDLNNQKIYIEWEDKDKNRYLDEEVFRDIDSKKDKIIFGWALSDKATSVAGPIKFAVRFYTVGPDIDPETGLIDENNKVITYSLSTLPQTIQIKESLASDLLDPTLPTIKSTQLMLKRIIKSTPDQGAEQVNVPVITEIRDAEGDKVIAESADSIVDIPTGTIVIIPVESDSVSGYIQARSTDGGKISCELNVKDNKGDSYQTLSSDYLPTKDTFAHPYVNYYILQQRVTDEVPVTIYEKYDVEAGTEFPIYDLDGKEIELYEHYYKFNIDHVGDYKIKVTNRKGASTNFIETNTFNVPAPQAPQVDTEIQRHQLKEASMALSVVVDPAHPDFVEDGGVISYQWYTASSASVDATLTEIPGAINASYEATAEDIYVLKLTNYLNKDYRIGEACTYYISNVPEVVTARVSSDYGFDTSYINSTLTAQISNYNANSKLPREFKYVWYEIETPGASANPDADRAVGCTEKTYKPVESGRYYFVVTNIYNGFEAAPVISSVINVV